MPAGSADFVLTDPPYLVRYCSRDGRTIANDADASWLLPAFAEIFRILPRDGFCVSFYGWSQADRFIAAWRRAGFRLTGHFSFPKAYASAARFLRYNHENAYLLLKGNPPRPAAPIPDVIEWKYSGNRLHPTQKPRCVLTPLIQSFSRPGGLVVDPFCGSGSSQPGSPAGASSVSSSISSIVPSRAGVSSPRPLERPEISFFWRCPVMRPEKEKLHKRWCLRAAFQRFSRAPDLGIPAHGRK